MQLKTLTKTMILGTGLLAATACREPIHRVPKEVKAPIVERIDSFVNSSINKPDTTGLELFATDTFEITDKALNKPQNLMKNLLWQGKSRAPEMCISSRPAMGMGVSVNGKPGMVMTVNNTYVPMYVESSTKAIMKNEIYTNEDYDEFYVPIEYYAKRSPYLTEEDFAGYEVRNYSHEYPRRINLEKEYK